MKRLLSYTTIALLLTSAAVSCVKDPVGQDEAEGITLSISCIDQTVTKADATKPGEDAYNENGIHTVHYFFYPEGKEGENAVLHGTLDLGGASSGSNTITTNEAFINEELFPSPSATCSVLLIANYSGTIDDAHSSVDELLSLPVTSDFLTNPTQSSFTMVSRNAAGEAGTVTVNLINRRKTTVAKTAVNLQRVCSKVTLALHVESQASFTKTRITGGVTDTFNEVWRPQTADILLDLGNANRDALLSGDPNAAYDPFDYGTTKTFTAATEQYDYYSYTLNTETGNYDKITHTADFSISEPFYSYPQTWEFGSDKEPYLKLVIPWVRDAGTSTLGTAYGSLSKPFYYKIACPGTALSGNKMTLKSNYWYKVILNVAILGSETDDASVTMTGSYYVRDWQDANSSSGGSGSDHDTDKPTVITGARYLSVAKTTYVLFNVNDLSIPFVTSDPCEITNISAYHIDYNQDTNYTHYLDASSWLSIVGSEVRLNHTLNNNIGGSTDYDVSPYVISFTLKHKDNETYSKNITIIQEPAIMITTETNTSTSSTNYTFVNNNASGNSYGGTPDGDLTNNNNQNPNMFIIETTVLPSDSGYLLGDPRASIIDNLGQSWSTSSPAISGASPRNITFYYPTSRSVEADDIIAPKFRIASSHGACQYLSYDDALKRCASYQEFGYPAGRWRLPTSAEIKYMAKLNTDGKIVRLLGGPGSGTTPYWCGDGYVIVPDESSSSSIEHVESTSNSYYTYVRCVYDEWYWSNVDIDSSKSGIQDTVDKSTFTWGDKQF